MNVSHIIYKVRDLQQGVEAFRSRGFTVEYGKARNPYNALIYFSNGPFIELLAGTMMPVIAKKILRFFGKNPLVDRLDAWDSHPEGPCGLALETYASDLENERTVLAHYGVHCTVVPSRRTDVKGRKLRFKVGYPDDLRLPFLMTYFNIDPKPKDFIHANGVVGISNVKFGAPKEHFELLHTLCNDPLLSLNEGVGIESFTLVTDTGTSVLCDATTWNE